MALVANKSDLEPKREIESEEAEQFAQENGMFYMETSAKSAENINELFHEIAKRLIRAFSPKSMGMNLNNRMQEGEKISVAQLDIPM